MLFARLGAWFYASKVARKHCVNWRRLLMDAYRGKDGTYLSEAGGAISSDAKTLIRQLVGLEIAWSHWGDTLSTVKFEEGSIVIPEYFGRDFWVPLSAEGVAPPSAYLKHYPFDVAGEVVLDVGAYLGDTPLMWLYKGARSVIAVEPVPLHFQYLEKNVAGLPVVCLNVALAVQPPIIPGIEGSIKYGLVDSGDGSLLDVPAVQLAELVEKYGVTVVKLNCEGCEHYVLEQLSELPSKGVKKIAVQFHEIRGYDPNLSLALLEEKLGKSVKTSERSTVDISGKRLRVITVHWSL